MSVTFFYYLTFTSLLVYPNQTFLRLLPLTEVVYTQGQGKADIDATLYAQQVCYFIYCCIGMCWCVYVWNACCM